MRARVIVTPPNRRVTAPRVRAASPLKVRRASAFASCRDISYKREKASSHRPGFRDGGRAWRDQPRQPSCSSGKRPATNEIPQSARLRLPATDQGRRHSEHVHSKPGTFRRNAPGARDLRHREPSGAASPTTSRVAMVNRSRSQGCGRNGKTRKRVATCCRRRWSSRSRTSSSPKFTTACR